MTFPLVQELNMNIAETLYSFLNKGIVSRKLLPEIVTSVKINVSSDCTYFITSMYL